MVIKEEYQNPINQLIKKLEKLGYTVFSNHNEITIIFRQEKYQVNYQLIVHFHTVKHYNVDDILMSVVARFNQMIRDKKPTF